MRGNDSSPVEDRSPGLIALIRSDYEAHSEANEDGPNRAMIRALPRLLVNPSMHAAILIRLSNASPEWLSWLWRNLLIWKHRTDIGHRVRIGPGMRLPHPFGLVIAPEVTIGSGFLVYHNVTIGVDQKRPGVPVIGDDVTIYSGSHVVGPIRVGDRVRVGANAYVAQDVPDDSVLTPPRGFEKPSSPTAVA